MSDQNQENLFGGYQQYDPMGSVDTYHQMYAQPAANNQIAPQQNTPAHNTTDLTTNGVCKKFIHGKCKQRQSCPYPHDKSKIKACQKFQTHGACPYGQRCNFSHDLKICIDFMKKGCKAGQHCPSRHVYKSCPNYDMGFCFAGTYCKLKHIVRKLCWDYTYGYCEKGNKCPDHHPKVFVDEDFKNTKILFDKLTKTQLQIIVCKSCKIIGHKVNKCPKRMEIQPKQVFKCGLCGSTHLYMDQCNYLR